MLRTILVIRLVTASTNGIVNAVAFAEAAGANGSIIFW